MVEAIDGRLRLKSSEGLTGLVVPVGCLILDVGCQLGRNSARPAN